MTSDMQALTNDLVMLLGEIQNTRSQWEPTFDVHATDLFGRCEEVASTPSTDVETIRAIISEPGNSFRAVADTLITIACWICTNGDSRSRHMLYEQLAPFGGVVTLLANSSGRYFSQFMKNGEPTWIRLTLAAITLLGDNADPREDLPFLRKVHRAIKEKGKDPHAMFDEFVNLSTGEARAILTKASIM